MRLKYTIITLSFFAQLVLLRANEPPRVSIIDPLNGTVVESAQIRVRYVISNSEPESVRILVNGRAVQLLTDVQLGDNAAIVDIPDTDCEISIIARNQFGASAPAYVNLVRSRNIFKPSLYVLAIGVSNYDDPDLRLLFPAKDATDFTQAMIRQAGHLYESVEVRLLTDRRATAENIRDGLYWLQTQTTNRDVAMLYIAGHGINNNMGDFFFMPVNADINRINATCVSNMDIKTAVSNIAGKILVFMDACHSGNVHSGEQQRSAAINRAVTELADADNTPVVFTSSTGRQFSLESPEWNNGAFTKALVEGLNGHANFGSETITIRSLDYYIANRVKELTNGEQAPTTLIPQSVPDFPIALVVGDVNINIDNSTVIIVQGNVPYVAAATPQRTVVNRKDALGILAGLSAAKVRGDLVDLKLTSSNVSMEMEHKPGLQFGITANIPTFKENVIFQTGLLYTQMGAMWKGSSTSILLTTTEIEAKMTFNYLQLPINFIFLYELGNGVELSAQTGIYIGYGLGGKYESTVTRTSSPDSKEKESIKFGDNKEKHHLKPFDFGMGFGIGVLFFNRVHFNLGYNFGLSDVGHNEIIKNTGIALTLSYIFGFSQ